MTRFVLRIVTCVTLFALIWPAGSLAAGQDPVNPMSGKADVRLRSFHLSARNREEHLLPAADRSANDQCATNGDDTATDLRVV